MTNTKLTNRVLNIIEIENHYNEWKYYNGLIEEKQNEITDKMDELDGQEWEDYFSQSEKELYKLSDKVVWNMEQITKLWNETMDENFSYIEMRRLFEKEKFIKELEQVIDVAKSIRNEQFKL